MKHIRNPTKWWQRLGRLIEQRADAIRHHRKRSHIEAEMRMIRTALMDWDNRQDRNYAPGILGRAAHGSAFRKMACGPAGVEASYSSVQGHQREH